MRRFLLIPLALLFCLALVWAADSADTAKAAATRKKLQQKVTVEYKDTLFRDVQDDLGEQTGVHFRDDTKGGVNLNAKVTLKGKDMPLSDVLNAICDKLDYGYYIISASNNAYDGSIQITRGKERGYEAGKEPDKTAAQPKTEPKDKTEVKTKPEPKDKTETKVEPKAEEDADQAEKDAGRKLKFAKELIDDGKMDKARERLSEIVKKYPSTKAAEEAQKLLDKQEK